MQSGTAGARRWSMKFEECHPKFVDPLMGWTGTHDTTQQLRLYFDTQEAAIAYATANRLCYLLDEPPSHVSSPKSYAANFAFHKRQYADLH